MTIRDLFEKCVEKQPDAVAQKWCENKSWRQRSWAEFKLAVCEVAEGYGRRFALKGQEDNAAIILQNSPTWMESYLAQTGTGVSVVPIDPKLHNDEVAYILKDAEVKVVTTDKAHLMMMMKIACELPALKAVVDRYAEIAATLKLGDEIVKTISDDLASRLAQVSRLETPEFMDLLKAAGEDNNAKLVAAAFAALSAAVASSAAIISARISFAFSSPLLAARDASASSLRPFL